MSAATHIQVQTKLRRQREDAARPSVMVKLDDPQFGEKFQQLFEEHIEGFTGLRGTKRPKTEKDLNMEWRVRLKQKLSTQANSASSKTEKSNGSAKPAKKAVDNNKARLEAIERYRQQKKQKR